MEYVKNNFNRDWNWSILSLNKNITIQDIENNIDMGWDLVFLSYNPNITVNFIKKHIDENGIGSLYQIMPVLNLMMCIKILICP